MGVSLGRHQCADAHPMHVIYRKVWLETLDAEKHHTGIEVVRSRCNESEMSMLNHCLLCVLSLTLMFANTTLATCRQDSMHVVK